MSGLSGMSDRVVETLARLQHYTEAPPPSEHAAPKVSIAISRQAGSRGADIARAVGARLNWPVYDNELLTRIAAEKGLHARLLERLDEHYVSWLEEMIHSFASHEGGREGAYLRHLLELFASLGRAGHSVIVGRGAAQVMPADTTLRVRIVAPRSDRVAQIEKNKELSHSAAEKWVAQTDDDRTRFIRHYFHKDPADVLGYDLILNSSRLTVDECADLIADAARALQRRIQAPTAARS